MKYALFAAAAVLSSFVAAPSFAQVDVKIGGYTSNYVGWADQDTLPNQDVKHFDILRDSEIHFRAEGKTENGITYGLHVEALVDGGDGFDVQESYLYLSSVLGKVNLGTEDGAVYGMQVSIPNADPNIDGLRQFINPLNYGATSIGAGTYLSTGVDYAARGTGKAEKITYYTPNWNGLQFGISYTPDVGTPNGAATAGFVVDGAGLDEAYEAAIRYETKINDIGVKVGGGYSHIEQGTAGAANDDVAQWNIGVDLDIGQFGIGATYVEFENNLGVRANDVETIAIGVDYHLNEQVKLGASYFTSEFGTATGDIDIDRYTAGVTYKFVPGVELRGSVSFIEHDLPGAARDVDATSVMTGLVFTF
jgi:outer membrane protein OmpU